MSELRERFRALDALEVPDVMSRARLMGPRPPSPTASRRCDGSAHWCSSPSSRSPRSSSSSEPSTSHLDQPPPAPPRLHPVRTARSSRTRALTLRQAAARTAADPDTGEVRRLVDAHSIDSEFHDRTIGRAAWSADGRWVAFEVVFCGGGSVTEQQPATGGLWVTNGLRGPRQLTTPCIEGPGVGPYEELGNGRLPARSSSSRADPSMATRWS